MARSTYIYLVYDGNSLAGGFTVKHEMLTWIAQQKFNNKPQIWRIGDGLYQKKGQIAAVDFNGTWNNWLGM